MTDREEVASQETLIAERDEARLELSTLKAAIRTLAEAKTDSAEWQAAREVLFPIGARP